MDALNTSGSPARVLPKALQALRPVVIDDLVRLGAPHDGGYVLPRSGVLVADALLSFGVGTEWSFEDDATQLNPNLCVHAYDHTITEKAVLDMLVSTWETQAESGLPGILARLKQCQSYNEFFRGANNHFRERIVHHAKHPAEATVHNAMLRLGRRPYVILKMDIEGDEYEVIDDILEYRNRIVVIVAEFHHTHSQRETFLRSVARIRERYAVVHLHGNNWAGQAPDGLPHLLEITFLRKDLCTGSSRRSRLPVSGLDFPNVPDRPDVELVFEEIDPSAADAG
jgi:hypothetical protein